MKVIIAGSRDGFVLRNVYEAIEEAPFYSLIEEVVSGCARGVDTDGEKWASSHSKKITKFPADWDTHGKAAGFIRNKQMGDYADALIAVWDGESKGTKNMIDYMKSLGKPVYVYVR